MPAFRRLLLFIPLPVFLAACASSGVTETLQTEHYTVQLNLDGVGIGERQATVDVRDSTGKPVAAQQVVLASGMRQMGMAAPEAAAREIAPGCYQATGEFFSMTGEWDVDVRVSVGGAEEVASFKIRATR
jgi:YtkA-like protein